VGGNGRMINPNIDDKNYVNPNNGEFTQVFIEKGNLTHEQIDGLINEYLCKKEKIINRNLTEAEKISLYVIFYQAIEEGKANPTIILELMQPSTNRPFKQYAENEKPQIQFRKPARYEKK
jgi:hypothetical protein